MLIIYLLEIIKYRLAYNVFFSKKIKCPIITYWGIIPAIIMDVMGNKKMFSADGARITSIVLVTMLVLMQGHFFQRFMEILYMFFIITGIDMIANQILIKFEFFNRTGYHYEMITYVAIYSITTVVLVLIWAIRYRCSDKFNQSFVKFLGKTMGYMSIVCFIAIQGAIEAINYLQYKLDLGKYEKILSGITFIAAVSLVVIAIASLCIGGLNRKLGDNLAHMEKQKIMQEKYYENMLLREDETRRYRHDMQNHLFCLQGLASHGDYEALKNYIDDMQKKMQFVSGRIYNTGNKVIDVLTNYHLSMLDAEVEVYVRNRFNNPINIEDMKLCTIYGNLLQNAVEEVMRNEGEGRYIEIIFRQGTNTSQFIIKNTYTGTDNVEWSRTKKKDVVNHGYGLKNVQRALEAVGGTIDINSADGVFEVIVSI